MNYLPPKIFADILKRDDLELDHEYDLVHHVRQYFKAREELTKLVDITPQESVPADLWNLLTDAEKKARNDEYAKKQKAKIDAEAKKHQDIATAF